MMKGCFSSIYGCLLGRAIGDALGYPVEFLRWNDIGRRSGEADMQDLEMDFEQGLSLISDDTQMALSQVRPGSAGIWTDDAVLTEIAGMVDRFPDSRCEWSSAVEPGEC